MPDQPSIAVVILNWNGSKLLEEFLPSVIEHSQYPNTTIYVADNASTDDSIAFLKAQFNTTIELIENDGNYGFAKGYNVALAHLKEDYFVLLNSDVEVGPNWIQPIIELMEVDQSIAACQPKILSYREKDHFEYAGAAGGFLDKHGYPFCRGRIFDTYELDQNQYDTVEDIFWASGACLFIRGHLFFEAQGFEEDFFAHMEEIDLCWRLQRMGYTIKVCPASIVYHLGGGTLQKMNPRKTYLNFRNNRLMLTKNIAANRFIGNLLFRNMMDLLAFAQSFFKGNFKESFAIMRALVDFHMMLPKWLKKRRALKAAFSPEKNKAKLYDGNIVFQYYLKKKKNYTDLS